MADKSDIGNRMKRYERVSEHMLPKRVPVIIRVDGRSFHTFTRRHFGKAWSEDFTWLMIEMARIVMDDIQGCSFCYSQSDEVSFLLTDYATVDTTPYFDYDLNKLVSVTASLAASVFASIKNECVSFDSRVFTVPHDDVCNYFIWRQMDAMRNAVQMAGGEYFSHKELFGRSCNQVQEMLWQQHKINFNDYPILRKRGFCIHEKIDREIPIFTKDRNYVEKYVDIRRD